MANQHDANNEVHGHEHHGLDKKKIWTVFGILLFLTVIEFVIALWVIPKGYMSHTVGVYIYIILTLMKAYYIVAYFMHLKYEKLGLQLVLSLSFLLIIYFIVLMLIEGNYLHEHMFN